MGKVEQIKGDKEAYYIESSGDGFNIGTASDRIFGKDAYKEVFKAAFYNERFKRIDRPEKEQVEPMSYVKNEMEELEDVQRYWGTEEFQNYIKGLEERKPEDAQKYKKAQIKKIEAVRTLTEIYKNMDETRASLDKIEKALLKLENSKGVLPSNVYKKCQKSLLSQQRKEQKKEQKLEQRKANIMDKTTLRQSINNAKEYHESVGKLNAIANEQDLQTGLKQMKENLIEKKEVLSGEKDAERKFWEQEKYIANGEQAYGNGTFTADNPGITIPAMEEEVRKIAQEISNQEKLIKQNSERKQALETSISHIHAREVESTIRGEKGNPLALNEGKKEVVTRNNANFVEKVEIDYTKVQENMNKQENDINKDKENEGRL